MSNTFSKAAFISVFMTLFIPILGAQSQETTSTASAIQDITIIGTRDVSDGLIDAPVKVEVLGQEYLEEQQYQDLSEGLADIPGVTTQETERRAGSKSAQIQGFGENSVLVMLDGVPVSQNSSFGFDLTQIATSDIEKVEVIKGGASALYGSQAMGGVINIVTKKFKNRKKAEIEVSGASLTEGESGQNRNAKVHLERKAGLVGVKATFSHRDQDAHDLDPSSLVKDGVDFTRQHGSLNLQTRMGGRTLFANTIFLRGKTISQTSRPYSSSAFGASLNTTDSVSWNYKLGSEEKLGPGTLKTVLNYETNTDKLALDDDPKTPFTETLKTTDYVGKRVDLKYQDVKIGEHSLTTGLLFRENTVNQQTRTQSVPTIVVETQDIEDKSVTSYEGFIQDNFWLGDVEISPGARYQYDQDFGSHVSPKINLSHYADINKVGFKTWLTVGTGYRAPSVKERFFTLDHSSVANYIVIGNENLSPEESISVQLGEEIKLPKSAGSFSLYGNLFLNRISNLIESVERESTGSGRVFSYDNIDDVTSRGVELGVKGEIVPKLTLRLNGSYTETFDERNNLLLANRPLYMGFLSLTYLLNDKITLIGQTRYTGSSYVDPENIDVSPDYTLADFKINYKFSKDISSSFSVKNIFDKTKDPAADVVIPAVDNRPNRGRELFLGLNLKVL